MKCIQTEKTPCLGNPSLGKILVDSYYGEILGFTSDKFYADSYLWWDGKINSIIISFISIPIKNRRKGYFTKLLDNIESIGRGILIQVPEPSSTMQKILTKRGFVKNRNIRYNISVWEKVVR